ncbi:hypothetical protein LVD15_05870 [Fulvivirga maritima]|uniref:hypothetical protein n=1 Tax=Fulvivirga maritima TaxID=2904247 RepID=UPI001F1E9697|nr:hypothetical protein [Fulvivirga maritima]UII27948.1 hypothetical protein LVD15_05870 [Fulvivirga maritima]
MKVLYLISNLGKEIGGGHTYSMLTTIKALSSVVEPSIAVIGLKPYKILEGVELRNDFVYCRGCDFSTAMHQLHRIFKEIKPDVIHAFDIHAYLFARFLNTKFRVGVILTKCGGPNPPHYFPKFDAMINFSKENDLFFEHRARYSNGKRYLIPNRVIQVRPDKLRINKLKTRINLDGVVFLRVARIGEAYESSIKQSINLVERLRRDGQTCTLLVVGVVYDHDIFQNLSDSSPSYVHFVTEDEFTKNASELINVSNYVIGTGRGLMEAASLGKVILTPVLGSDIPVLVDDMTFQSVSKSNFSPRNEVNEDIVEKSYLKIRRSILDVDYREGLEKFSQQMFKVNFDLLEKRSEYNRLYLSLQKEIRRCSFDLLLHLLYTMRTFVLYKNRMKRNS